MPLAGLTVIAANEAAYAAGMANLPLFTASVTSLTGPIGGALIGGGAFISLQALRLGGNALGASLVCAPVP